MRKLATALFVVFLGGGAALITEVVWIRQLEQILGGTALAVAAMAGAFLCAMGLGSLLAGRLVGLASSPIAPHRALFLLQSLGALWAFSSRWGGEAVAALSDWLLAGSESAGFVVLHYVVALAALLVPGVIAGALVPLVAEIVAPPESPGKTVAWLWASDGLGSALCALLVGMWLLRTLGCDWSFQIAAILHAIVAAAALRLPRLAVAPPPQTEKKPKRSRKGRSKQKSKRPKPPSAVAPGLVFGLLALAGLAGVGWQALWSRLLVLVLPGSVAWPAIMIACWIGGGALGAWAYGRSDRLRARPLVTLGVGQAFCAAGALLGAAAGVWWSGQLAAGRPIGSALVAELALCLVAALPAALAMGVALPAAVDLLKPSRGGAGQNTGRALAVDLAGAAVGTLVVPLLLVPRLGLTWALVGLAATQAVLGLLIGLRRTGTGGAFPLRTVGVAVVALACAAWLVVRADLRPWTSLDESEGEREPVRVVWGPMAAAAVVRDPNDMLRLFVDRHHGMGGEQGVFIERRQGHLPLLLQENPETVAVVGVGTGNTLGAVLRHDVERVDAAESLSSVLQMLDLFAVTNRRLWRDDRVRIHHVDGHAMLRRSSRRYDVIISDLVHPWRAGASGLYARDHLEVVRRRLAPGGLFCFWLPLHELAEDDLAVASATFLEVFGDGTALLGHLGRRQPIMAFVAGGPEPLLERSRLARTLGSRPPEHAVEADLDQPEDLQSLYLGGTDWLRELAGSAPVTTWDRPELAYRSAATWWRGTDGLGEATLAALLERRAPVEEVVPDDENARRRHRAVGILLRAELEEAADNLDAAARGYREAARADPTFRLPRIALTLLQRRLGGDDSQQ